MGTEINGTKWRTQNYAPLIFDRDAQGNQRTLTDYLNNDFHEADGRCCGQQRGMRQTNRDNTNEELRVGKTRGPGNIGVGDHGSPGKL